MPSSAALSGREKWIIDSKDIARLATVSASGWPHCVPVSYIFESGRFCVPAHSASRKVKNVERVRRATLVIDDEQMECGVMLECSPALLGKKEAKRWRERMRSAKGWSNDEKTAVISLKPLRKSSWFLKG